MANALKSFFVCYFNCILAFALHYSETLPFLVCFSGDGTLSVFNIRRQKIDEKSDNMQTELLSVAVVKVRLWILVVMRIRNAGYR